MGFRTEITSEEKELLIKHYEQQMREIEDHISQLNKRLEEVKLRIGQLEFGEGLFTDKMLSEYNRAWSLAKKVEFVLGKRKRSATTSILADLICEHEPEITEEEKKSLAKDLGAVLKQKVDRNDTFKRYELESGRMAYGLSDWFDEEGIMDQYKMRVKIIPLPRLIKAAK